MRKSRSFVTYFGKIAPIKASDKIETYGELEVLEFIEKSKTDKNLLLVDSRTENWYNHETIATAINVPYVYTKNLNTQMSLLRLWRLLE